MSLFLVNLLSHWKMHLTVADILFWYISLLHLILFDKIKYVR